MSTDQAISVYCVTPVPEDTKVLFKSSFARGRISIPKKIRIYWNMPVQCLAKVLSQLSFCMLPALAKAYRGKFESF
jgi:hypothetical protein